MGATDLSAEIVERRRPVDRPAEVFRFLAAGQFAGQRCALATLTGVEGGSSRQIGAQLGVLEDGSFFGQVSGGCVEGVVAAEAAKAIREDRDAQLRLGRGSRFFDIVLPCGGAIDLSINVIRSPALVGDTLSRIGRREPYAVAIARDGIRIEPPALSRPRPAAFRSVYLPPTRLLALGRGPELATLAAVAGASGMDVEAWCVDESSATAATASGAQVGRLTTPGAVPPLQADQWTAAVLLFHDLDWDLGLLPSLLAMQPFYIGALGSSATQTRRLEALRRRGFDERTLARIKGPVGLFASCRDSQSLAISILADVLQPVRGRAD